MFRRLFVTTTVLLAFGSVGATVLALFPLALHGIHGSAELCRTLTRVCDVLDSKHELEWTSFAKFRRRGDFDFVCNGSGTRTMTNCDGTAPSTAKLFSIACGSTPATAE